MRGAALGLKLPGQGHGSIDMEGTVELNRGEAVCRYCGKVFAKRSGKQVFCRRNCFKSHWDRRPGTRRIVKPLYRCPWCYTITQLKFNPRLNSLKIARLWRDYRCEVCHRGKY
jgi:hypothetical protein